MVLNPWKVQSIDEFNYFCCPECVFRAKEDSSFQAHALQNHVLSKTLFHGTEENDLGQGNLFIFKGYCQLVGCGSICCLGLLDGPVLNNKTFSSFQLETKKNILLVRIMSTMYGFYSEKKWEHL